MTPDDFFFWMGAKGVVIWPALFIDADLAEDAVEDAKRIFERVEVRAGQVMINFADHREAARLLSVSFWPK